MPSRLEYREPGTRMPGRGRGLWVLAGLGVILLLASVLWCMVSWNRAERLIFVPVGDVGAGFASHAGWVGWVEYAPWEDKEYPVFWIPWALVISMELAPAVVLASRWKRDPVR